MEKDSVDQVTDEITGEAIFGREMFDCYKHLPWVRAVLRSPDLPAEFTFENLQLQDRFECIARVWLEDGCVPQFLLGIDQPLRLFTKNFRAPTTGEFITTYLDRPSLSLDVRTRILIGAYSYQRDTEMIPMVIQEFHKRHQGDFDLWTILNVLVFDESDRSREVVQERKEALSEHAFGQYLELLQTTSLESLEKVRESLLFREDLPPYLQERIEDWSAHGSTWLLERCNTISDMRSFIRDNREWTGWILANLDIERVSLWHRAIWKIRHPFSRLG